VGDDTDRPAAAGLGHHPRLYGYTRRYAASGTSLSAIVVLRAIQLPFVTWALARVLSGPDRRTATRPARWPAWPAFLVAAAFTELCFVYRYRFALRWGGRWSRPARRRSTRHLLRMPMSFFSRAPGGRPGRAHHAPTSTSSGSASQDVAFVSTGRRRAPRLISSALMIYYDWRLFLVVAIMVPGVWVLVRRLRGRLGQAHRDQQESFARVTATLAENVAGIREIQSFARQAGSADASRRWSTITPHYNMSARATARSSSRCLEWNGQLFLSLVLVIGGYQALVGGVPLAALIQFLFLSNGLFAAIPNLGNQYNQALAAMAGAERVFALLDTGPRLGGRARRLPDRARRGAGRPGRGRLRPTSPIARAQRRRAGRSRPGRTIALVGATGSGKSTLASLVAKLYLPTAGRVSVRRRDLAEVSGPSLRRQIACVTQDNFLYSGTVADNIRVGRPGASDDEVRGGGARARRRGLDRRAPGGLRRGGGRGGDAAVARPAAGDLLSRARCSPTRAS
jgi:ATP-binding cassette subfamily B protein